mgnify:CR=1 FL=1
MKTLLVFHHSENFDVLLEERSIGLNRVFLGAKLVEFSRDVFLEEDRMCSCDYVSDVYNSTEFIMGGFILLVKFHFTKLEIGNLRGTVIFVNIVS